MNQNDEWYTPGHIIKRVKDTMGTIEFDPFSCDYAQQWVRAERYCTIDDSAFNHQWHGKIFMNPPYSATLIRKSIKTLVVNYLLGQVSEFICLTNSATDTRWNEPLQQFTQAYTNGRIQFIQPNGEKKAAGSRGQCFTYAGPNIEEFIHNFTYDKFCWIPNVNHKRKTLMDEFR